MIELCLSLCPTDFEHTVIDSGHVWACDRITSIEETSKVKDSLTRKLAGYRNWRQWWCKKEENKGLRKRKMRQKSYI